VQREFIKEEQFPCKMLIICQTVLLWTSHVLHTEIGTLWDSHHIQCSLCNYSTNKSTPLADCTFIEKCALILFLWSKGLKPSKIHRRMLTQYRETVLCKGMCTDRWKSSKVAEQAPINENCSSCPITSQKMDNTELVNVLVQDDRRITAINTANKLNLSCQSAYSIIQKDLRYHKIYARSLLMSTNGYTWKCACNLCNVIVKEKLLCNGLLQVMKHGYTTTNLQANIKACSGHMCQRPGPRKS